MLKTGWAGIFPGMLLSACRGRGGLSAGACRLNRRKRVQDFGGIKSAFRFSFSRSARLFGKCSCVFGFAGVSGVLFFSESVAADFETVPGNSLLQR